MKSENSHQKIQIAVFASGGGSNAKALVNYFKKNKKITIALFVTNNPHSGVISMGKEFGIRTEVVPALSMADEKYFLPILRASKIDFIALAGFLKKIPDYLLKTFPNKIINIHPSLLPKYGGKGMYGHYVHEAVKNSGDTQSGCTIHLVNEEYDQGRILHQEMVSLSEEMSAGEIAALVLAAEHKSYGRVLEKYISDSSFF